MHVNFHFCTGRTSFLPYLCGPVYHGDGENKGILCRDQPWKNHVTSGDDKVMWRVEFVQRPRDTSWSSLESKEERDTHACGQGPPHLTHTLSLTFFHYKQSTPLLDSSKFRGLVCPHLLGVFFLIFLYFFDKNKSLGPYPTIKISIFFHFLTKKRLFFPSFCPFFIMAEIFLSHFLGAQGKRDILSVTSVTHARIA